MVAFSSRFIRVAAVVFIFFTFGFVLSLAFGGEVASGKAFFTKGNFEEAISVYMRALDSTEDLDGNIHYRIGLCNMMDGNLAEAGKYFGLAQQRNPGIYDGRIFRVPSGGMMPTLLMGDSIIVDDEFYESSPIVRFDVVLLRQPGKEGTKLIKRIVGLPGETMEIRDHEIYINNRKLEGDVFGVFGTPPGVKIKVIEDYGPIKLSDQDYFVLGDNRNRNLDSKRFGPVKEQAILGKALVIYRSVDSTEDPPIIRQGRVGLVIE